MSEMKKKTVFETLNAINVNEHTEKKNGLTYLPWAWAWAEVKKAYPLATFTIYEDPDGRPYHNDGRTCWVKTGVTIEGMEHVEYLPVMDYRNQSIPLERVTSMDVIKSLQRSLTKAAARHGLGLYVYAGEDLPETEQESLPQPTTPQLRQYIDNCETSDEFAMLKEQYGDFIKADPELAAYANARFKAIKEGAAR